jgi:hypothetical protein
MSKTFSASEVAAHKDAEKGMYIIIDEGVYDITGEADCYVLICPPVRFRVYHMMIEMSDWLMTSNYVLRIP